MWVLTLITKHYQLLAILALVGVVTFFIHDYQQTKQHLAKTRQELAEQQVAYKKFEEDFAKYQQNVERLDQLVQRKSELVQKQTSVKEKMNSVPVKKDDRPFADPGLLDRARILRDYQKSRGAVPGR